MTSTNFASCRSDSKRSRDALFTGVDAMRHLWESIAVDDGYAAACMFDRKVQPTADLDSNSYNTGSERLTTFFNRRCEGASPSQRRSRRRGSVSTYVT